MPFPFGGLDATKNRAAFQRRPTVPQIRNGVSTMAHDKTTETTRTTSVLRPDHFVSTYSFRRARAKRCADVRLTIKPPFAQWRYGQSSV